MLLSLREITDSESDWLWSTAVQSWTQFSNQTLEPVFD